MLCMNPLDRYQYDNERLSCRHIIDQVARAQHMNRRTFVTGGATLTAILFGGCIGLLGEDRKREGVTLSHVELGNASGEPQVFDLLVTYDNEIIHWSAHEVAVGESDQEMGSTIVDIDAPDDRGHVEVAVRVGQDWQRTDFATDRYDGKRVIAVVVYGMVEDELLRISRRITDRPPTDD